MITAFPQLTPKMPPLTRDQAKINRCAVDMNIDFSATGNLIMAQIGAVKSPHANCAPAGGNGQPSIIVGCLMYSTFIFSRIEAQLAVLARY
jgi:hypothetical protein